MIHHLPQHHPALASVYSALQTGPATVAHVRTNEDSPPHSSGHSSFLIDDILGISRPAVSSSQLLPSSPSPSSMSSSATRISSTSPPPPAAISTTTYSNTNLQGHMSHQLTRPTPIHLASVGAGAALTVSAGGILPGGALYKPVAMYDPAVMQQAYLNPHFSYHSALVNQLYPLPYSRPELAFYDRHNAFAKGEYLRNFNRKLSHANLMLFN